MSLTIIIPFLDEDSSLKKLLDSLIHSKENIFEIIIINTGTHDLKNLVDHKYFSFFKINIQNRPNLFPGQARNEGISLVKSEFVGFLDSKTIPKKNWVNESLSKLEQNYQFVFGKYTINESEWFPKILRACTNGLKATDCLPGSVTSKKLLERVNGFNKTTRAGEDIEFFTKLKMLDISTYSHSEPLISYSGLPRNLFLALKKWYRYSFENSKINILSNQKFLYGLIFLISFLYFLYSWNYLFTGNQWNQSTFFIPHLNTTVWGLLLASYFSFRSIILPLKNKENITFIFPLNFIFIGIVGILIDLIKMPGRLVGMLNFFTNRS